MDYIPPLSSFDILYSLILQLPAHLKFKTAITSDEDEARKYADSLSELDLKRMLEDDRDAAVGEVSPEGWTHEIEMLTQIADSIDALRFTIVGMLSKKSDSRKFERRNRPVTARERMVKERLDSFEEKKAHGLLEQMGF
nr:MAG TPA: hypothetical protein [Caudoviricetes sp.]